MFLYHRTKFYRNLWRADIALFDFTYYQELGDVKWNLSQILNNYRAVQERRIFFVTIRFMILGKWPTWLIFLFCAFIIILYMFPATSCSSSGESIVSIQHLVDVCHSVSVTIPCAGRKGTFRPAHGTVTDTEWHTSTRYCIDTVDSPDVEHEVDRNM